MHLGSGIHSVGRWRAAVDFQRQKAHLEDRWCYTFLPLYTTSSWQYLIVLAGIGPDLRVEWQGQKSWDKPCARCHWLPDIAIWFRGQQGRVMRLVPLSDLEPFPCGNKVMQPWVFHFDQTSSNILPYLEQQCRAFLHPHAAPTHIPQSGTLPPVLSSEGSNRLPVNVEKPSPSVLLHSSHVHIYTLKS